MKQAKCYTEIITNDGIKVSVTVKNHYFICESKKCICKKCGLIVKGKYFKPYFKK